MLFLAGWWDCFIEPIIKDFKNILKFAPERVKKNIKIKIGPFGHLNWAYPPELDHGGGLLDLFKQAFDFWWFDHWLKGDGSNLDDIAPIQEAAQETDLVKAEDPAISEEEPAVEPAEETVIEKSPDDIDFNISKDFRIEVDLGRQRLIVFHKNEVLKEMVCSGGAPESPTPLGEYSTTQKIEYA